MLRLLCCLLLSFLVSVRAAFGQSQPAGDTLDVVNWNIEWFGDSSYHDPGVQATGVRSIMEVLKADVYAFCEVVDVGTFKHMVGSLSEPYDVLVSTFGSFAADTNSGSYAGAQKLALVFRKGLLRNVSARPMLASSVTAYVNFSSGRFPYEVQAEIIGRDLVWRPISFIVIHAKAFTDANSCARRIDGCRELKDTLDRYYPNTPFLLLGDFNDDLDVSNCPGFSQSNYAYMINDSLDYVALTLPISRAGAFSSDGYSSLIDHVIASNEIARYYVPNSAQVLRSLVKSIDPNYGYNISDHFPVLTQYVLDQSVLGVTKSQYASKLQLYPNPAKDVLRVSIEGVAEGRISIYDQMGRLVQQGQEGKNGQVDLSGLNSGIYYLRVVLPDGSEPAAAFRIAQ